MNQRKVLGGALLITGTAIGAVTIALPIVLSSWGMIWGIGIYFVMWAMMTYTGLCVTEVSFHFDKPVGYLTMVDKLLGFKAYMIAWFVFLMLLYALVSAYLAGFADVFLSISAFSSSSTQVMILPGALIGICALCLGQDFCNVINRLSLYVLLLGFVTILILFISSGEHHIHTATDFKFIFRDSLTVLVAFGYQVVLPSVRHYVRSDHRAMVRSILLGSGIALMIYVVWSFGLLSILPATGAGSIEVLKSAAEPVKLMPQILESILGVPYVGILIQTFLFTAIMSSYIGITLSLYHFLQDGLRMKNQWYEVILLSCLTILPPLFLDMRFPGAFMATLAFGGVFVCVLNVILPVVMVASLRIKRLQSQYHAPGGWLPLLLCMMLVVVLGLFEIHRLIG